MRGEVFTVANGVTLFRLGLFALFIGLLHQGYLPAAITLFVANWALDFVDGFLARRLRQTTELGDRLDKVADRLLLFFGPLAFLMYGYLPDAAILLLTKDIATLPVISVMRERKKPIGGMGLKGKIMTLTQGAAMLWLLVGWPYQLWVIGVVAVAGGLVGALHLYQVAYQK